MDRKKGMYARKAERQWKFKVSVVDERIRSSGAAEKDTPGNS